MEIIILYWFFSTIFIIGQAHYHNGDKLLLRDIIGGVVFGWVMLPFTLGTKAQKDIENEH
jgi:hypothetical protein